MSNALAAIRRFLDDHDYDVFLGSSAVTRRYLTAFTGSSGWVWLSRDSQILVTDFRYVEQAGQQCQDWEIVQHDDILDTLREITDTQNVKHIAVEGDHMSVNTFRKWESSLPAAMTPVQGLVEGLRQQKRSEELEAIRQAADIADQAFAAVLPAIRPGASEREIALELEFTMRRLGASSVSFDPIVASGSNGARPHARPSEKQLRTGDFVVIDFGCVFNGYCSDMTRTLLLGAPTDKHREVYDCVLRAQTAGLAAVRPGRTGREVDAAAREVIESAGYGERFGHGLGHGVGLEVHEEPRLSKKGETQLAEGMVVTVEPGVYLPGFGGVRIEDLVVVTPDGADILSRTPKELVIID